MCRKVPPLAFKFPISAELTQEFKSRTDPELWAAREAVCGKAIEPAQEQAEEEQPEAEYEDGFELEIKYGNRHRLIPNAPMLKNGKQRNHEWTCFVQINGSSRIKAQDVFKSVMFTLPACYANRYREVCRDGGIACKNAKSWFECKEAGWGTVNVQMELKFRDDLAYNVRPVKLQHITSFRP